MTSHAPTFTPEAFIDTASVGDYFSLLKPRVMSLVIFTALCGLIMAPGSIHPLLAFIAVLCIAVGAGAAGCLNMWYEDKLDGLMTRTKTRPIPAGRILREEALTFGIMLSFLSVLVMTVAVDPLSAGLLLFTIFFYVVIYTMWLKPATPQNIVIGGAAGALPPVIAWAAVTHTVPLESLSLFLIIFMWTPPHFWALALLTQDDYTKAGIPMLPNTHGEIHTKRQIIYYAFVLVMVTYAPSVLGMGSAIYLTAVTLLNAVFLLMSFRLFNTDIKADKRPAIQLFMYSIFYLFTLFLILTLDCVISR
jgi:heme o synthase